MMARILAIDLGEKRVGLAISDPLGIFAQALPTYLRVELGKDLAHLLALVKEYSVATVVVGLPLKLDGTEGPAVERTRKFTVALANVLGPAVPIVELDERMTTKLAGRELRPLGRASSLRRAGELDRASAQILLTVYLGMKSRQEPDPT